MSTEGTGKGNGKGKGSGMDPGDDEPLWQLMGRLDAPEVSPYFSRRVLRDVAQARENERPASGQAAPGWLAGWRRTLRGPRAAVWRGVAIVGVFWLSVVLTTNAPAPREAGTPARAGAPVAAVSSAVAGPAAEPAASRAAAPSAPSVGSVVEVAPQDVEVIADLDTTITREENRLWTEDSARF